nr:hypothetical protein [uncultured Pseudomonas sp.]
MATANNGESRRAGLHVNARLAPPRIPAALPLTADEDDIALLPRTLQSSPVELEVDAWGWYSDEYQALTDQGVTEPEIVLRVLVDGVHRGVDWIAIMQPDPAAMFPIKLQVTLPRQHTTFGIQYEYYIRSLGNELRSENAALRFDRVAPNEADPFVVSGPGLIDRAHLNANGGMARFELPRWDDIRIEDEAALYFQPFDDVDFPSTPIQTTVITPANKPQRPILLWVDEAALGNGRFRVSCHLQDRSGNVNRQSNVLDIHVDLNEDTERLPAVEPISPYVSIFGWINCQSLETVQRDHAKDPARAGLKFRLPSVATPIERDGPVQLTWQVCWDMFGEEPVAPTSFVPGSPIAVPTDRVLLMPRLNDLVVGQMQLAVAGKRQRLAQLRVKYAEGNLTEAELIGNAGKIGISLAQLRTLVSEQTEANLPMESSVRVGYRMQDAGGRWRDAATTVFSVSLQKAGGRTCSGPWPT